MQGLVLQTEGALGVGLVNAVRGATVSIMAALLFCRGDASQCLTPRTALSATIITAGALGWVAAGQFVVISECLPHQRACPYVHAESAD